jgi:hypothetical protein
LQAVYPEHKFKAYNRLKMGHTPEHKGSKSQTVLFQIVKSLFPDSRALMNYKVHVDNVQKEDKGLRFYEFDVSSYATLCEIT